ncbi:MAG: hypothetical protein O3A95_07170 [Planctomycetota bacterium]|nr:hypothetical protein [Planctomycetota bacterium]MDA1114063.1 hypothetical protein [Planctomycetota bacterium]
MLNLNRPSIKPSDEVEEGSFLTGIPGHYSAIGLGLLSLGLASVAYLPDLSILAMVDIPITFLCFLTAALVGFGSREKMGLVLTGVFFSAAGLILAALHLVLVKNHPWFH